MKVVRIAPLMAMVSLACGPFDSNSDGVNDGTPSPTTVRENAPSTSTGSLSGQLLDSNLKPLSEATVTAILGVGTPANGATAGQMEKTTTTDARGFWSLEKLPGNSYAQITVSKPGYAAARFTGFVEVSYYTSYAQSNTNSFTGAWVVLPTNGTVKFRVSSATGRPAKGAKAILQVHPTAFIRDTFQGTPYSYAASTTVVEGTADDSGVLTFTGIPDPAEMNKVTPVGYFTETLVQLTVLAYDENGDGVIDSGGASRQYSALDLMTDNVDPLVVLDSTVRVQEDSFYVLSSSIPSLTFNSTVSKNMIKPGQALTAVYTHAIQPESLVVELTDETGVQSLALTTTLSVGNRLVTIQPTALIQDGHEYNLSLHAISADTGDSNDTTGYFFGGDLENPIVPKLNKATFEDTNADNKLSSGEVITLTFNAPIGFYGFLEYWHWIVPPTIAYLDCNLGGTATIGDYPGEKGYIGSGFEFQLDEPTNEVNTRFSLRSSGYSTRYSVYYSGSATCNQGVEVQIGYNHLTDTTTGMQSVWGQAIRAPLSQALEKAP